MGNHIKCPCCNRGEDTILRMVRHLQRHGFDAADATLLVSAMLQQ